MKKVYLLLLVALSCLAQRSFAQTFSFAYTGSVQYFTVPSGVTQLKVIAKGAMGGYNSTMWSSLCSSTLPDSPGRGGCIEAVINVTPGQIMNIYVGGKGTNGYYVSCAANQGNGGWNGGGNGGYGYGPYSGGGGGGASDVRLGGVALTDRVIVAAGGGGAGGNYYTIVNAERGGHGGGLTGMDGYGNSAPYPSSGGAQGGQPGVGGAGGTLFSPWIPGSPGTLGLGGNAGTAVPPSNGSGGGGGGAGYYGGGGGCWGGGGGGSSWADPAKSTGIITTMGCNIDTNGSVDICITTPPVITGGYPVCAGVSVTLSSTVGGGKWKSSNTSIAIVDSTSGMVTGITGGSATITYTIASACATVYATKLFSVIPAPAPITGTDPICVGLTGTYSDATAGGGWTISSTALASFAPSTGAITALAPGFVTLTYTEPKAGCFSTKLVTLHGLSGPTNVCAGSAITISSSTTGGTWTSSTPSVATVGTSGIVSGVSLGTSTISYSSPICPSSFVVHVNPIAPNVGADSVCLHSSTYATNVVGGGYWVSSDPSVAKVTSGPGLVSGISIGTATLSYITAAGCLSKSTVNVIGMPPMITGYLEVCPGNTITLSDTATWGEWSTLNTSVATINPKTGVLKGITADTVTALYTVRPGCSSTALIIVNPLPYPITGPDTLCPGVIDTVHSASFGGIWTTSTPALDTIVDSTGRITAKHMGGTAVVKYTLPTGCFATKNIIVRTVPLPNITYDWPTQTFHAPTGYDNYQWYDSVTGKIPHANSPTLAAVYYEWYYVVVTDANGCEAESPKYYFEISVMNVKSISGNDVKIYPNPVRNVLNVDADIRVRAVITTIDGKIVIDQPEAKQIDVSRLADAAYNVSLYDDSGQLITVRKLIKQ